jgi:D-alanyl-D-alanine carboxypeptidase
VRSSLGRYRWAGGLGALAGAAAAIVLLARAGGGVAPAPDAPAPSVAEAPSSPVNVAPPAPFPEPLAGALPNLPGPEGFQTAADDGQSCARGPGEAATANALSLTTLVWSPYRRPETGWETYAPQIAAEIGTRCAPGSPGFAAALLDWQRANRLAATGILDPQTYGVMNNRWLLARPFVIDSKRGCPPVAAKERLVSLTTADVYGKPEQLDRDALAAYRRMVADARAQVPAIAADRRMLTVFSGFRDPETDALRCAKDENCQGVTRTVCSAHRTGRAVDLMVGAAPGLRPDSSADANRLAQSRTPAYLWLVANARRYGFVNYTFEPWHWEWTGPTSS